MFFHDKAETVEFRLFPAMPDAEQVKMAVEFTVNTVTEFIAQELYKDKAEITVTTEDLETEEETMTHNINEEIDNETTAENGQIEAEINEGMVTYNV